MDELLPCPFCGAGETRFHEVGHWTGMQSVVIAVRIKHWCPRADGQPQSNFEIAGKTREDAIAHWNKRAAPPAPAVPEGYVLVPVEPTPEIIAAGWFGGEMHIALGHANAYRECEGDYARLLAAADRKGES